MEFLVSSGPASRVIEDLGCGGVDLAPLVSMSIVTSNELTKVLYPGQVEGVFKPRSMIVPPSFTMGNFFVVASEQGLCRCSTVDDILVVPYFS